MWFYWDAAGEQAAGRKESSVVRESENHSVMKKFSTEIVWRRQTDKHAAIYMPAVTCNERSEFHSSAYLVHDEIDRESRSVKNSVIKNISTEIVWADRWRWQTDNRKASAENLIVLLTSRHYAKVNLISSNSLFFYEIQEAFLFWIKKLEG